MATLSLERVLNEKQTFCIVYTLELKKYYSSFTPK